MNEPTVNLINMQPTGPDAPSADGSRIFRPYASMASKDTLRLNIPVRSEKSTLTKVKDYGTGILKGGLNTITGLLTPTGMMMALGTVGLSVLTGGAVLPFLAAAGMGLGAFQMVKGAFKGDWEQAGEGTFTFATSVLGTKSAMRMGQSKNASAVMGENQPSALPENLVKTEEPIPLPKNQNPWVKNEDSIASENAVPLTAQETQIPPPQKVVSNHTEGDAAPSNYVQFGGAPASSNSIFPVNPNELSSPPKSNLPQAAKENSNRFSTRQFLASQSYAGLLTGNLNGMDDRSGE